MNIPTELYYSKEHTWLKIESDIGIIGITDFAQSELGEIVYVDLPNNGYTFKQHEVFGSVEALKTVSDLFMPISGKVIETNKALLKDPTLVNNEPFTNGWMMKIEIESKEELSNLLPAAEYQKTIGV
jgi:glycine cleavage system H protein